MNIVGFEDSPDFAAEFGVRIGLLCRSKVNERCTEQQKKSSESGCGHKRDYRRFREKRESGTEPAIRKSKETTDDLQEIGIIVPSSWL